MNALGENREPTEMCGAVGIGIVSRSNAMTSTIEYTGSILAFATRAKSLIWQVADAVARATATVGC